MSPKLPVVTGAQLVRALERDGWFRARQHGSHVIMRHSSKPGRATVPVHTGQTLPPGIVARALTDTGLTIDDLRRLL